MERASSRRRLLGWCGVGLAGVAGCLRLEDGGGDDAAGTGGGDGNDPGDTAGGGGGNGGDDDFEPPEEFSIDLEPIWEFDDPPSAIASADGDFFVRQHTATIECVRPDGERVFSFDGDDDHWLNVRRHWGRPLYADDQAVYCGANPDDDGDGAVLYALDRETGDLLWTVREPADGLHDQITSITTTDDLVVYVSQSSGSGSDQEPIVRALDRDGEERWRMDRSGEFVVDLRIVDDRLVLQETFELNLYDLDSRELLDDRRAGAGFNSSTLRDDVLYVAGDPLSAIELPSGDELWSQEIDREANTPAAVGSDAIFFGTEAGFVLAHDRDTGEQLWEVRVDGVVEQAPVVEDGVVWVADDRGGLSAFDARDGEQIYGEDVSPGFNFAIEDGIFADDERPSAFEIQYQ